MADSAHTIDPTRRAILSRMPAAAIGVGALLGSAVAAEASPNAVFQAVEADLSVLIPKWNAALDAYGEAETLYYAKWPSKPSLPSMRASYETECARLNAKCNVDKLEAASREYCHIVTERLNDLAATPATTVREFKFKAKMAADYDFDKLPGKRPSPSRELDPFRFAETA